MFAKLFGIGLDNSLDFEESIQVKLLNAVSFLFLMVSSVFIAKHLFFTHRYDIALVHFLTSTTIPFIFFLQHKHYYAAAKVMFFVLLHAVIFISSAFLLLGNGVENFFIVNMILVLILVKRQVLVVLLLVLNAFLYVVPQVFFQAYESESYSLITYLVLFGAIILAVQFFIIIQNQFKERLKIQNGRLEKLNEEKNDLMSIVAHDLKNPLTQIKGLVSILELSDKQLSAQQRELIEKIKGVTDNQYKQISGYLNGKSFEDSYEDTVFEKVLVRRILETVLDEMLAQAIAKGIRISYKKDAKRNLSIAGRNDWLAKIVSNLLSNAIKFSNSGTEIIINVKSLDNQVIIIVQDQGQGFNKEEVKHLFKKNKVLSATPTANESSSGVGLYIVKKYVNQMYGEVSLESEEGIGSSFYVKFPRYSKGRLS